ncbi:MAG: helix-turn-helix domain-containing protein, partial [Oscillospiraceae bacterium]|nr:helix-turn-helix domain-containing protein [Candidatus Equicaccousia limihippi]
IKGVSITGMCNDAGISRSLMSELKAGRSKSLSSCTLEKIADYFSVSTDYVLGKTSIGTDELSEYLEMLASREELRTLFKLTKDAGKNDVEQAIKIIEAIKN